MHPAEWISLVNDLITLGSVGIALWAASIARAAATDQREAREFDQRQVYYRRVLADPALDALARFAREATNTLDTLSASVIETARRLGVENAGNVVSKVQMTRQFNALYDVMEDVVINGAVMWGDNPLLQDLVRECELVQDQITASWIPAIYASPEAVAPAGSTITGSVAKITRLIITHTITRPTGTNGRRFGAFQRLGGGD